MQPSDTEFEYKDDTLKETTTTTATDENSIIADEPVDKDAERLERVLDANDDDGAEMTVDQSAKSSSLDANVDDAEMTSQDKNPTESLLVNEIKEEQHDLNENEAVNLYVYNKYLECRAAKKDFTDEDFKNWAVDANNICQFETNKFVLSNQWLNRFKAVHSITTSCPGILNQLNENTGNFFKFIIYKSC